MRRADHLHVPNVSKSGSLNLPEPSGPLSESQSVTYLPTIGNARSADSSTKPKYTDSYLSLGFTYTGGDIAADALLVLYNDMLANSSTLPAKLRRRRDTDHPVC